jgi:hypothetical protein
MTEALIFFGGFVVGIGYALFLVVVYGIPAFEKELSRRYRLTGDDGEPLTRHVVSGDDFWRAFYPERFQKKPAADVRRVDQARKAWSRPKA